MNRWIKTVLLCWIVAGTMVLHAEPLNCSGTVTDTEGVPLEGVKLRIMPVGHQDVTSDAQGHFTLSWDPSQWRVENTTFCLVARHQERELGLVLPLDKEQTGVTLQLKSTLSVSGQIVNTEGQPIAQGQARPILWMSNIGSTLSDATTQADDQGRFTIKALPTGYRYTITALAEGFGQSQKDSDVVAVNNQMDLGTFTLPLADQSLSGKVVDLDDKPVSGARIYAYGEGQPDQHDIKTDDQGEFVIEQICSGRIHLNVNYFQPGQTQMYGIIESEGGATDVIITVSPQGSHQGFAPRSPKSLMGKALPDLKDLDESLTEVNIEGHPLLLCFWDMQQRPARHSLIQLAQQTELLQQQGVKVIAIQTTSVEADALNAWLQKQQISFKSAMMTGDVDKTKFAWGIKALPWMVLTNQDHQVVAEGFPVRKLSENLAKVENRVEEAKEMPR